VSICSDEAEWAGRRIDFPAFQQMLFERRQQVALTPDTVLRNSSKNRSASKLALLAALESAESRR